MRSRTRTVLGLIAACSLLAVCACGSAKNAPKKSLVPSPHFTGTATLSASPSAPPPPTTSTNGPTTPRQHIVVVVMENHSYSDIIGSGHAPYLNALAARGASLTQMFAITHPSQPNYVALFSGGTHGVTGDACPQTVSGANLATQISAAGLTFAGYSEGLPSIGSTVCTAGHYARRHVPWTNWPAVPGSVSHPFTDFPSSYDQLPTLSFVIPNLDDDMHDGTVAAGDAWLKAHLDAYAQWAATHDSQLVVTWDEDDKSENNQIPTIIVGAGITPQKVSARVTLYSLLRYLEDRLGLPRLGAAATAAPITLKG